MDFGGMSDGERARGSARLCPALWVSSQPQLNEHVKKKNGAGNRNDIRGNKKSETISEMLSPSTIGR
jgi:hypothetical protein